MPFVSGSGASPSTPRIEGAVVPEFHDKFELAHNATLSFLFE
jgi:hypothetical protein